MKFLLICILFTGSMVNVYSQTKQTPEKIKKSDTTAFKAESVTIQADRIYSAASDHLFRKQNLQLLPRNSAQDILRIVPGLVTAQHAGGGKAEQIFLRGFDCDHGTDVNINVDGAPVNMVSHGHGQGYADLHFIIPETIEHVEVMKGPYAARNGDLTTAGAVTFRTADTLPNSIAKLELGSFKTLRGLALCTTSFGNLKSYGGIEYFSTRNFFDAPQDFIRMNYIGKVFAPLTENSTLSASVIGFTSEWNASGQIPERAVRSGLISRYGTIDPNEGGKTSRTSALLAFETQGSEPIKINASFTRYQFQLYSNFTFFAEDSVRGDMIEQTDQRSVFSLRGEKNFFTLAGDIGMKTTLGGDVRYDDIHTALYHDTARVRLETTRDNAIRQMNLGVFAEHSFLFSNFSLQFGVRGDYIGFDVDNLMTGVPGSEGISQQFLVSPKFNASWNPSSTTTLFYNFGLGFHSNDARVAVSVPTGNTLPRAYGSEIGARWSDESLTISTALWILDLDREFIWVGDEGTTEESGRSRRVGMDVEARYQVASWLTVGSELTLSRGRLLDLPDGSNFIPLSPNVTLTSYASITTDIFTSSLRLRHISDRPANEDNSLTALGYTIVDVTAQVLLSRVLDLTIQCENILNSEWREAQFDTSSRLRSEASPVSEVNYTPGTRPSIRVGLSMKF